MAGALDDRWWGSGPYWANFANTSPDPAPGLPVPQQRSAIDPRGYQTGKRRPAVRQRSGGGIGHEAGTGFYRPSGREARPNMGPMKADQQSIKRPVRRQISAQQPPEDLWRAEQQAGGVWH